MRGISDMQVLFRVVVLAVPLLVLMLLTRPLASEWPDTVARLRQREPGASGSFNVAIKPVKAAWKDEDLERIYEIARSRARVGFVSSDEDARTWAVDALLLTLGCTHKRCYLGVYGAWHRLPDQQLDLYAIVGAHGLAVLFSYNYGMTTFFRHFSPRFSAPHTIFLAMFATSSPFELIWLSSSLFSVGATIQRIIGRGTFLLLYGLGAMSSVLIAAYNRHSASGASGVLAAYAYHALAAPRARHSLFGVEMGGRAALMVNAALATWPMINGGSAPMAMALTGTPALVGAAIWYATSRG